MFALVIQQKKNAGHIVQNGSHLKKTGHTV